MNDARRALITFFAIVIPITVALEAAIIGTGQWLLALPLMWSVGIAAIATVLLLGRRLSSLGWRWPPLGFQASGYGVPLFYAALAYGLIWGLGLVGYSEARVVERFGHQFGLEDWADGQIIAAFVAFQATVGVLISLVSATGEEIGWRGFLVPELAKVMAFPYVCLVSGTIWAAWHWPLIIFSNYHAGGPTWFALVNFTVMAIAVSVPMTYWRLKSGSLWPAAIAHASHNLFVQQVFTPMTVRDERAWLWIDEFGLAVPAVTTLVAFYYLAEARRRLAT